MPRRKSTTQDVKKKTNSTDERVAFVVDRFNASWNYAQTNYHQRWENAWKLYNNQRVKQSYVGISNVFVPITFSTIEVMVSALAGSKPSFDFLPPKDKPDQNTDVLNALLDDYWDKDQWNIKIQSLVRSMLIYGTGVGYLYWDMDHPVMVNVPLRDFFFDPNAVSIENCSTGFYAGRRYLTTKEDLESYEVVSPDEFEDKPDENGEPVQKMVKKYRNLDQIVNGGGAKNGDELDKARKELFYGSTAPDPENTQIEVLELWTEDRVISVANRSVLIQDEENPYLMQSKAKYGDNKGKGIIPFIVQRDYVDESLLYAKGEVDIIADLQEDLNDLRNQKRDFISYILNPMWNLDPNKSDMADQIEAAPGVVFPLKREDLTPVLMPNFPNEAFSEEISIQNDIRESTAVDQIVKGVTQDTNTTATEVNAQIASAGQRIGMKITQLENESFHRLARIVFEMVKLYVTQPMLVRVVTDTARWEQFNPEDFQGDYDPKVQLQSTVEAKKNQDVKVAQEMFLALSADPQVNQEELKRIVLPRMFDLDTDEIDRLLTPAEPRANEQLGIPDEEPMTDVIQDPLTNEMLPIAPGEGFEPTPEELMALEGRI